MYDDAYTIQWTEPEDVSNFNYVAGMVPFLFNLIQDVSAPSVCRRHHYRQLCTRTSSLVRQSRITRASKIRPPVDKILVHFGRNISLPEIKLMNQFVCDVLYRWVKGRWNVL